MTTHFGQNNHDQEHLAASAMLPASLNYLFMTNTRPSLVGCRL